MEDTNMRAGGSLIALGTITGTIAGSLAGQPSAGLLGGFLLGAFAAVLVWVWDRGRARRR